MAGVADKASIKEKKSTTPKKLEPQTSTEQIAKDAANAAVSETVKGLMPLFQEMIQSMQKGNDTQAILNSIENNMGTGNTRVMKDIQKRLDRRINENKRFMDALSKSPRKDYRIVRIPKIYKKHLGSTLPVGLNGSVITIPVNGNPYLVHKDYLPIINQKLQYIDQQVSYMEDSGYEDIEFVDDIKNI